MATNDNAQPLLVAGKLPKDCYTDLDEFVQDLSKVLALPLDAVSVIKGAQGEKGEKGEKGNAGPQGETAEVVVKEQRVYPIAAGVKFVEFNIFLGWETAVYSVTYNGRLGSPSGSNIPDFDPTKGIVGPGTTVPVYNPATSSPTVLRHYFMFTGGLPVITATPDQNFVLRVTTLS